MTFNVTKEEGSEQLTLNGILNQRSQDVLTANKGMYASMQFCCICLHRYVA